VSIGHSAVIHGCKINDLVIIGMGAKLLDNCLINSNSIVAAGSVIKENFIVPEGTLTAGVPAKVVRDLRPEEIDRIKQNSLNYLFYCEEYKKYNKGIGFQKFNLD
jgi:carbonic anhydrase/acetyltransferase-like protein (isoleucine patch superfamily)